MLLNCGSGEDSYESLRHSREKPNQPTNQSNKQPTRNPLGVKVERNFFILFYFYLFIFKFYFIFKLYIIVLVLPNIKMNPPQVYMCSPSWTVLPPPSPYHPSGSSQCTSPKHPVSNLDWQLVSYMILYVFQCHSPKSSHPLPLPQSPKDCSIHQCLFCCLVHRVIVTIFLNSIYMR